ncbi:hypothetical protein B0T14DRAFT_599436 [Immersiella caudata]|uniref:Uncharacterized protein n=1 Tax=Immersiella caudata TaxID=314043 RepID=A0AA39X2C6_9PEZI|nr:hypothetical protein B0T14DRAFT_599436 [Immersiella caudata]
MPERSLWLAEMLYFPQSKLDLCYPEHFLASPYWSSMTAPADVYWAYSPGACPAGWYTRYSYLIGSSRTQAECCQSGFSEHLYSNDRNIVPCATGPLLALTWPSSATSPDYSTIVPTVTVTVSPGPGQTLTVSGKYLHVIWQDSDLPLLNNTAETSGTSSSASTTMTPELEANPPVARERHELDARGEVDLLSGNQRSVYELSLAFPHMRDSIRRPWIRWPRWLSRVGRQLMFDDALEKAF